MAKVLTKNEIIKKIAECTSLQTKEVKSVLECLHDLAIKEVKSSGEFRIADLGKLKLKNRAKRTMRNPQNGKMINVPAKKVVKFSVSKAVKETVAK